ncbi:MAG TPA: DUF262 domain-containing protein [Acidimicrobiia bacterium]|nr:DUF262 domain-containing protein [Acidimicrobiia bacterium]
MKISTALVNIDSGQLALPEFQRGYVWNRSQVRSLMQSLYREDPVGTLLIWTTEADPKNLRNVNSQDLGTINLLLDGQQRITTLYGLIRGQAPPFFQGDEKAFIDLYFNAKTEVFEFYGPIKMKGDPTWVSVTEVFDGDIAEIAKKAAKNSPDEVIHFMERLLKIDGIQKRSLHEDVIAGQERTIDEVVEIFNRINSGGTKLSAGDLALARICADWPQARAALMKIQAEWQEHGYDFTLDWLLRCVTAVGTNQAKFPGLRDLNVEEFANALNASEKHIGFLLNLVGSRLGLDHNRVLGGRGAFAALAWLVHQLNGEEKDQTTQQKILYWYLHCLMWGRYSSSVESKLQRDLDAMKDNGIDGAIEEMRKWRGDLTVRTSDFDWSTVGARFYPILYLLTRTQNGRDLLTGIGLRENLLGKNSNLHLHHIFPKALLRKAGYDRKEINSLANMCFLTASSNFEISDKDPAEYLPKIAASQPGVLESQWITTDPTLWSIDKFPEFLVDRRERLTKATNQLLDSLYGGQETYQQEISAKMVDAIAVKEEESAEVTEILKVVAEKGIAHPEINSSISHQETDETIATVELVWHTGIQPGLTNPVCFAPGIDAPTLAELSGAGYQVFDSAQKFIWHLETQLNADIDGDNIIGEPSEPQSGT